MKQIEVIAEIGQNFNGDIDLALQMIDIVKEKGADVAKFQVYDAKALFPKENNPWYDYNCGTELSRHHLVRLNARCEQVGIEFMASVFDVERVEWLEDLGMRRYKIASRSITDQPLIDRIVQTGKPILASLGMWDQPAFPKISDVVQVDYLFCISKYPTPLEDLNFNNISFDQYAGFSDHTIGNAAPIMAMARGAGIIEKHFTLDKEMYGPDHACSMVPDDLKQLCDFRDEMTIML